MTAKEALLETVEALSESYASLLLQAIERHEPVLFALVTAPEDDEPLTDDDQVALAEADEETISHGAVSQRSSDPQQTTVARLQNRRGGNAASIHG